MDERPGPVAVDDEAVHPRVAERAHAGFVLSVGVPEMRVENTEAIRHLVMQRVSRCTNGKREHDAARRIEPHADELEREEDSDARRDEIQDEQALPGGHQLRGSANRSSRTRVAIRRLPSSL